MNDLLFAQIKKEYDDFYRSLLKDGKLPLWSTGGMRVSEANSLISHGFWNAAIADEVCEAFKRIGLHKFKSFLDIGSGDGKVVLIASLFCKNAEGIEIDGFLHNKAVEIQKKFCIQNAKFFNKDFFEHDFSKYEALFLAPDTSLDRGLESKLLNEMKGKLIHFGHHFQPRFLKKEKDFLVNGTLISVYSTL